MLFLNKEFISLVIKIVVQIYFPGLLLHDSYKGESYFPQHQVS